MSKPLVSASVEVASWGGTWSSWCDVDPMPITLDQCRRVITEIESRSYEATRLRQSLADMLLRHFDGEELDRELFYLDLLRRTEAGIPSFRSPGDSIP